MMETENGNRFYDESGNQEQENSFNRFNGNSDESGQGTTRREGRPRFVRVDYNNRPQYSRVERPQRQEGEQGNYQDRPRRQYGQNYGENQGEKDILFIPGLANDCTAVMDTGTGAGYRN